METVFLQVLSRFKLHHTEKATLRRGFFIEPIFLREPVRLPCSYHISARSRRCVMPFRIVFYRVDENDNSCSCQN